MHWSIQNLYLNVSTYFKDLVDTYGFEWKQHWRCRKYENDENIG